MITPWKPLLKYVESSYELQLNKSHNMAKSDKLTQIPKGKRCFICRMVVWFSLPGPGISIKNVLEKVMLQYMMKTTLQ